MVSKQSRAKAATRAKASAASRPLLSPESNARPARWGTWHDIGFGALLFAVAFLAYWPALSGGVLWDDDGHITRPALRSVHGLWRIWFELGATQQYYPLLHSAFWIEHRLWGDAFIGYHLTNVLLHAGAACLAVAIMRKLALPGAWLAGFIFALHPVSVEAVAWISEQKSTLSAVFYLGSALVYLHFDQTRRRSQYFLSLLLFMLALLSKTVTATLPAALLVIFWWKRGRLDPKRDVRPLLPWIVLGATAGLFTAWVERNYIGAKGADFTLTLLERFLLAGRVIWFYLGKLFWPANLIFIYPHWNVDPAAWWQYLFPLGIIALAGGLLLVSRRHRGPLAAFLFFTGTLFPVMGFFNVYPFKYSYVADHFQYLASLGIIVLFVSGLAQAVNCLGIIFRRLIYVLCGSLLLTAGLLTFHQAGIYRDAKTLYRKTLVRNPSCWMAHNNLGIILAKTPGHLAEAVAEYEAARQIKPDDATVHINLAAALQRIPGRLLDAVAEYETVLRKYPEDADARNNLGVALMKIPGRSSEAMAEYEAALRISPDSAETHYSLGTAFRGTLGRLPDAIAELQTALRINPDYAEAQNSLGCALGSAGRLSEAIVHFQAAVRIKPDDAEAHYNLGNALMSTPGRWPDAVAELQTALRIDPDYAEAHINLGCALGSAGRTSEAIVHFQAAVRIKPDYAEAHKNLGMALSTVPGRLQSWKRHCKSIQIWNPPDMN
jgi:tetratricopeptide (TPR) repeat protein